ncbi:hypothetical protein Nepgr_018239 [Nepenthes gracilis]|uniref:Fe2OG dioxygenase domain-containing protein n=1 Tax=Nepenthes gracilis TaxID=150966 RepID=A0AAD3SQX8_NEPGR|nr:hypothetical protein Nepgr_018239 [Nepenthes gracilis]
MHGTPDQRSKEIHNLGEACQHWGFFMVVNHGVPEGIMKEMIDGCKGFFDLTAEEKREFLGKDVLDPIRCGTSFNVSVEKVHFWRDFLKVTVHPQFHFPHKPFGFREVASEYCARISQVARGLFGGISKSLGFEESYVEKALNLDSGLQILVANLYPPCPQPELAMGMPPHSDLGLLTLVIQNELSGLEVYHNGRWIKINPIPNSLLVNIADSMEIFSNGRYKSNLHRAVVNSTATRISLAIANGPSLDTVVGPAAGLIDEESHPALYMPMKYRDYMKLHQGNHLDGKSCLDRAVARGRKYRKQTMAARSIFFSIRRWNTSCSSNVFYLLPCTNTFSVKSLCSEALRSETLGESLSSSGNDDLKSRIFRLRLPKRSATNVIQKWVDEGNQIAVSELRHISRELRKLHRYKHALEISEWIVAHDESKLSDSDYAVRIDLMTKVFGIDTAERYFEGLPHSVKTNETYTALLHSYAGAKLTDKAEKFYERMKDSGLPFNAIIYNEMMTLYMSVGQVEKVSSVVNELKRQKVSPDLFTYNLWISSFAATLNIDGVQRILDEMIGDPSFNEDWLRYRNLVSIYLTIGQLENSGSSSLVQDESGNTQRKSITYDLLIILHAGLGNKDKIDQIWKSLRMTKQKMANRNYVCIVSSYLILGQMKAAEEVIDQWKQSTTAVFDNLFCNRLMDAFAEAGLLETTDNFRTLLK